MSAVTRNSSSSSLVTLLKPLQQFSIPILYLGTFLVRTLTYSAGRTVPDFLDGVDYIGMATGPFNDLFGGTKPFVVPLLYHLLGTDVSLMTGAQLLLSLVAWGFLAWRVGALLAPRRLQLLGILLILGFSVTPIVSYWDLFVLSESVSISLMACLLAAGLWLFQGLHPAKGALFVVVAFLWAFTSRVNTYMLLLLAGFFVLAVLFRRIPKAYLALAVALTLIFVGNYRDADIGNRGQLPMMNVIGQRVLVDPEMLDYFKQHGMPFTPALMERAGQFGFSDNNAFYNDPQFAATLDWLTHSGKSTYLTYMLTHPLWALTAPSGEFSIIFSMPYIRNFKSLGVSKFPGEALEELFSPMDWAFLLLVLAGAVSAYTLVKVPASLGRDRKVVLPILVLFVGIAYGYVAWHGDTNEPMRHCVQASILVRLALWMLVLFALERLAQRRSLLVTTNSRYALAWRATPLTLSFRTE